MPEMHFHVRWPDGRREAYYSPSLVVKDFLTPDESYALDEFVAKARTALTIASERVREKYGFACSSALDQLARIEAVAGRQPPGGRVAVERFEA
ncbi:MSMEG_0570 family nitrogen starvation response protein [Methylobacterium sp. P1-11]|uniref:MSMEG_0570 family nitrogen starvation response protein n=1 Tax=Methylobacterium sp. P1-11 TaxID=2024616 RepID=UPI0011EEFD91|nr:MSMEG_0570 family nitrogen starvation response protein [Methylobacterium sp. P1-11]KAA0124728.1 MSMEG_0570 family nitrogen starvation response protein [Methylobacterium sp. P1-11]